VMGERLTVNEVERMANEALKAKKYNKAFHLFMVASQAKAIQEARQREQRQVTK